jgi:hypothetical protein
MESSLSQHKSKNNIREQMIFVRTDLMSDSEKVNPGNAKSGKVSSEEVNSGKVDENHSPNHPEVRSIQPQSRRTSQPKTFLPEKIHVCTTNKETKSHNHSNGLIRLINIYKKIVCICFCDFSKLIFKMSNV